MLQMPIITVLDGFTLNPGDLDWQNLQKLGKVTLYDRTPPEEIIARSQDAQILVVNKVKLTAELLEQLPNLQCICVSATGYNNVDIAAANARNIVVCNVIGYSTTAVAQHVFAMILALTNKVQLHHQSVQEGDWTNCSDFSYSLSTIPELADQTMGIYGLGRIGQKVADLALAFGMKVIAHHKHPVRDAKEGVRFVDFTTLLQESDVLTLHAPLTAQNQGIINLSNLKLMKPTAILVNTGRGDLIQEEDLKEALQTNLLAAAALDVLSTEPPAKDHVLLGIKNCLLTPHIAWASQPARQRLMNDLVDNVVAFLAGQPTNVVTQRK